MKSYLPGIKPVFFEKLKVGECETKKISCLEEIFFVVLFEHIFHFLKE